MITQVGEHRVKCGDLMDGIGDLMINDKAYIFYSDPPWGQGNLNYWQTINTKMTGADKKTIDLDNFINKVFETANEYTKKIIFIEYGVKYKEYIIKNGEKYGLKHNGVADLLYRSGSGKLPLHLHIFSKGDIEIPNGYFENLKGSIGMQTLRMAVTPFAVDGEIILDVACGMGYTAQIALETGMIFRGNEINASRLSKTIKLLENAKK